MLPYKEGSPTDQRYPRRAGACSRRNVNYFSNIAGVHRTPLRKAISCGRGRHLDAPKYQLFYRYRGRSQNALTEDGGSKPPPYGLSATLRKLITLVGTGVPDCPKYPSYHRYRGRAICRKRRESPLRRTGGMRDLLIKEKCLPAYARRHFCMYQIPSYISMYFCAEESQVKSLVNAR